MIETFGVNTFRYTSCGNEMVLWEIWHHKYGIIYNILDKSNYRNIIDDIDEDVMPQLTCPSCGSKFKYKKTDNR